MRRFRRRCEEGFTLIELLVVVLLDGVGFGDGVVVPVLECAEYLAEH
jgi:prepilin-type N-terminal cleavage/methylation domain-containing protein